MKPGTKVIYKKNGYISKAEIMNIQQQEKQVHVKIKLHNGIEIVTNPTFIVDEDSVDVSKIPTTNKGYQDAIQLLMEDQIYTLRNPEVLSDTQKKFLKLHDRLNHLSMKQMVKL